MPEGYSKEMVLLLLFVQGEIEQTGADFITCKTWDATQPHYFKNIKKNSGLEI